MLKEQDQLLLINLFVASVLYVNAKLSDRNPFVKTVLDETISEQQAFTLLTNACNDLAHLMPMLQEVNFSLEQELNDSQTVENKEVNSNPLDIGNIPNTN